MGGLELNKTALHSLLTNPVYAGKIVHKKDVYDGEHEAIISPEVFQKVQSQLQANGRTGSTAARNKHGALLRGLLFCKACGTAMVHTFTSGKRQRRYRYYVCTRAIKNGRKTCPSGTLPATEIERVVVDQIRGISQDEAVLREVLLQARAHADADIAALDTERHDLENELARHHRDIRRLANEPISAATTAGIAELNDRIIRCERRAVELRDKIDAAQRDRIGDDELRAALGNFDGVWRALSPKEQARLLTTLVARVDYDAAESNVAVAFHSSGIKTLSQDQVEETAQFKEAAQ